MNRRLQQVFRCDDQSALIHNYVASDDPPPAAWGHHSAPQSPLGRVSFLEIIGSEVLTIVQGLVYTRAARGQLIEHSLTGHEWLPWCCTGRGEELTVGRTVTYNLAIAQLRLRTNQPALLLLELRGAAGLKVDLQERGHGLRFLWDKQFAVDLAFTPKPVSIDLSDDPAPLKRKFAGFDDVKLNDAHCRWAWAAGRRLWVGIPFRGRIEVRFHVQRQRVVRPQRPTARAISFAAAKRAEEKRWQDFFEQQVPPLATDDPVLRDTYYFAWQMLWSNRCDGGVGLLQRPFNSPSRLAYGAQWWFDEPFNSVVYRYLRNPRIAYVGLENFWRTQRPDGAIPGNLRMAAGQPLMTMQPPIIGLVLQLLKEKPGWPKNLRAMHDALLRLARWHLGPKRDTDRDGLAEYHHCFDGPADQSQRWDSQKLDPNKVIDHLKPTESADFNVWMSLLWQVLSEMAERMGETKISAAHAERAKHTMELVERHMWDERDGFYYDIDGRSHQKIRVKTPYGFMPLLSPYIHPGHAERLVREHVFNPGEFWCKYPLPSVSLDNPTFDPVNMFRGPSWVNANWLVVEGLERQGFHREAVRLAWKTIELVGPRYRRGRRVRSPRFWEWYHPHTGEGLGNPQYGWSALVVDMIMRFFAQENDPIERELRT